MNTSFSTDVRMHLRLNGHTLKVGQLGPGFIIIRDPIEHPPAEAELTISIDGEIRLRQVYLTEGISAATRRTKIVNSINFVDDEECGTH